MNWKIGFFIILLTLVASNIYWFYTTIDNAVTHSYYRDSCEPMFTDFELLTPILVKNINRQELREYLLSMEVEFDSFIKEGEEILVLSATEIVFESDSTIKSIKSFR
ncbi:MAG: hypothetical protein OCD76_23675 [Reichenbachiella sp.]